MTAELLRNLLEANVAGALGVALVLLLRRPVRRLVGPGLAYALWLAPIAAMTAALLPGRIEVVKPVQQLATVIPGAPLGELPPVSLETSGAPVLQDLPIAALLFCAWAAGVVVILAITALNQHRAMRSFGVLTPQPDGVLRASDAGCGPATVGLLQPRVVLPPDFEQRFDAVERALIVAHEETHLRSGHVWLNTAAVGIRALNWFNPLVHIGAFYARVDQELACDAAVVGRFPGERRTYAQAMLKSQLAGAPLPLGCAWPSRSNPLLKERIEMLALHKPNHARRIAGATAIALAAGLAGYSAWATQPPRTVTVPSPSTVEAPTAARRVAIPPAAPVETKADTTLPQGPVCLTNACDDPTPAAGRSSAVSAAIASGDISAVIAAGGTAENVLEAMMVDSERDGNPSRDLSGRTLRERYKTGSATWATNNDGRIQLAYDLNGGGYQTMGRGEFAAVAPDPNMPDINELRGRPRGSTPIVEPPTTPGGPSRILGYRGPDGQVLPNPKN